MKLIQPSYLALTIHFLSVVSSVACFALGARAEVTSATSLQWYSVDPACSGNGIGSWATATNAWRAGIGVPFSALSSNDGTIFWSELADESFAGDDSVNWNIDTSDIAYLGTHGGKTLTPTSCYTTESSSCDYTNWSARLTTTSGDPQADCSAWNSEMRLSNQAEFLDVFACNSLEPRGGSYQQVTAAGHLHQWHGFAGTMAIGTGGPALWVDDYLDDVIDGSASNAWVTNLTVYSCWGGTSDCCATSRVWGNGTSDALNRALFENYDTFYSDPNGSASSLERLGACDPPSPIPGPLSGWGTF